MPATVEMSFPSAIALYGAVALAVAVLLGQFIGQCRRDITRRKEDEQYEHRKARWRDNASRCTGTLEIYGPHTPDEPILTARMRTASLRRILTDFDEGRLS